MKYDLSQALQILSRTPEILAVQLNGLSDAWLHCDEGPGTWSPFLVVGHLIVNEQTNFLPRTLLILSNEEPQTLQPIDMHAHFEKISGISISDAIWEFSSLRKESILQLEKLIHSDSDLHKTAIHPKVGTVSLLNVLSTWVAHDLTHLAQISRVMAKQYKDSVGPFIEFLPRLK